MAAPDFVAVGHVTLDRFGDTVRVGGAALYAVIVNLVLTLVLTPLFNLVSGASADETLATEYRAPLRT